MHLFFLVVTVGLQQTFYNVNERDGSVMACVVLSGSTERNISVSLDAVEESAQGIYAGSVFIEMMNWLIQ